MRNYLNLFGADRKTIDKHFKIIAKVATGSTLSEAEFWTHVESVEEQRNILAQSSTKIVEAGSRKVMLTIKNGIVIAARGLIDKPIKTPERIVANAAGLTLA